MNEFEHVKEEIQKLEGDATADVAKAKGIWSSYKGYLFGFVLLVVGIVLGHLIK